MAAACCGVFFLSVMTVYETIDQVFRDTYGRAGHPNVGVAISGAHAGFALLLLIFGFLLLLLAWRNYRASRRARSWTVTFTVLSLCCCGAGALFGNAGAENVATATQLGTLWNEARASLAEQVPPWYELVSGTTALIGLVALVTATALLATPPSNRFFRSGRGILLYPYPHHPYAPR